MLSVPEFEKRLKSGRYETQGAARRAAWKLVIPEKVRVGVLEGISRHFGAGFKSINRPETSTSAPVPASFAPKLGEVARTRQLSTKEWKAEKRDRSEASRAGGFARAAKLRREREELEALRAAQAEAPTALPPSLHIVPPVVAAPPVAPPSSVSLADVRAETDRVVRELASKMPVTSPAPPEGVEHAYKLISESARELFECLAAAVKEDERLRPDMVRAAHSLAMLVETGNDILISKLTTTPEAPKSAPRVSEAAE